MDSKLTANEKDLLTVNGFMKAYYSQLSKSSSYNEAYEEVEKQYVSIYGRRRYKNYDSFRKVRDRVMR